MPQIPGEYQRTQTRAPEACLTYGSRKIQDMYIKVKISINSSEKNLFIPHICLIISSNGMTFAINATLLRPNRSNRLKQCDDPG